MKNVLSYIKRYEINKKYHTLCLKVLSHQRQREKEVLSSKQTDLWYVAAFSLVKEKEDTTWLDE